MATHETSPTVDDYVGQRAELLARLVLTRKKGVKVIDTGAKEDLGLDMIVQIAEPVTKSGVAPVFGVQVKGTLSDLPDNAFADKYVASHWREWRTQQAFLFPAVFLLFSMEDDKGYFGWVMRPDVTEDGNPTLTKATIPAMASIKHGALDVVLGRVYKWYGAMSKRVLAEAK
jgi:hypothetical protein